MADLCNDESLREAIELMYFGYRAFTAGPDEILAQRGLNRVHHRVLYFVGRNDAISVGGLLGVLAVSKQALHAPLRDLVRMGLVSKEPSTSDRRIKQLRLTAAGRRLEKRLTGTQMTHLSAVFSDVGPNAERNWRRVMRAMRD